MVRNPQTDLIALIPCTLGFGLPGVA